MADNNSKGANGAVGLVLGGMFAIAAAVFVLTGGAGEKKVNGDADLPPVASPAAPAKEPGIAGR